MMSEDTQSDIAGCCIAHISGPNFNYETCVSLVLIVTAVPFFFIKKVNDYDEKLLYCQGNRIDINKLKKAFPFL